MIKKLIISIYCLTLFANSLFAGAAYIDCSKKTPFNSGLRSAIFPGWGQAYNKQPVKGYIIGGSLALSLIYSFSLNQKANQSYNDYQNNGVIDSALFSDYENYLSQSQNLLYLAAGIWVYGIFDAYFKTKKDLKRDNSAPKGGLSLNYIKSGCYLAYRKSF